MLTFALDGRKIPLAQYNPVFNNFDGTGLAYLRPQKLICDHKQFSFLIPPQT